jgi:hypothetical protein
MRSINGRFWVVTEVSPKSYFNHPVIEADRNLLVDVVQELPADLRLSAARKIPTNGVPRARRQFFADTTVTTEASTPMKDRGPNDRIRMLSVSILKTNV